MEKLIKGFRVENLMCKFLPSEDAYGYKDFNVPIIAVADGVTRDPVEGILPDLKTFKGRLTWILDYPRPSPASYAANIFCRDFINSQEYLSRSVVNGEFSEDCVLNGFNYVNLGIESYNEDKFLDIDYLKNDLAGCVGVGAVIVDNDVFYGYIADCGFVVFNKNGNIRFKTKNEGPNSKGSIDEDVKRKYNADFQHPEGRQLIRKLYRNNPSEDLSYGVLTGEKTALSYVKTGHFELKEDDIAIVFSDGLEKAVESGNFADLIRKRKFRKLKRFCTKNLNGKKGSLVYCLK